MCKLGFADNAESPINTSMIIYNVVALNAGMCDVYSMVLDSMAEQARSKQNVVSDAIQIYTETNADSVRY